MTDSTLRLRYQTFEFDNLDLHLCTLRDNQQFYDPDGKAERLGISSASWPIFGIVWPSGMVLAHHLANMETKGKRILEVGCGIGLSSLLLNKQGNDITATDYHPEAALFLSRNSELNKDPKIPFECLNWSENTEILGLFDLIIGSDILYEDEHVDLLADFLIRHSQSNTEIILVDPGRGRKTRLAKRLQKQGFEFTHSKVAAADYLPEAYKGDLLIFKQVLSSSQS